jgi:hypothetical protein
LRENPDLVKGIFGAVKEAAARTRQVPVASNSGPLQGGFSDQGVDLNGILNQISRNGGVMSEFITPPQQAREYNEEKVTDLYRKMVEQDDNMSVTSNGSERSIGTGKNKALITPHIDRKGSAKGNVIKL